MINHHAFLRGYLHKSASSDTPPLTREDIIRYLREYGDPSMGIGAGSAMVLHGLRDSTSDIDASALPELYDEYLDRYGAPQEESYMGSPLFTIPGTPIDLHKDDDPTGDHYEDVPDAPARVQRPETLLAFYLRLNREKDQEWIAKLKEHLSTIPQE